jgi:hypothetical protein
MASPMAKIEGSLEVVDVALDERLAGVRDRSVADPAAHRADEPLRLLVFVVKLGEQRTLPGPQQHSALVPGSGRCSKPEIRSVM